MSANNKFCKIEDFIMDDSFVEWVLESPNAPNVFWAGFLTRHPECAEEFDQAKQIILSLKVKPFKDITESQVDQLIKNVRSGYNKNSIELKKLPAEKRPTIQTVMRYAAIAAIIFSVGLLGYSLFRGKKGSLNQYVAQQTYYQVTNNSQEPMLLKLPDYSSVVLKPNTRIKYLKTFTGNKREVYLKGEAFFEVSKDNRKPFFVYAGELVVRVVGTSFIIKECAKESKYSVLVSTGRVEVSALSKNTGVKAKKPMVLVANQEGVLYSKGLQMQKSMLKKPLLLSQESTEKHFNFIAAPFSKVVASLREAYGVTILYDEKVMGNCQLTASLIDQPLDERLKLICQAVEASYKYENGQIVIDGKGCNTLNTNTITNQ